MVDYINPEEDAPVTINDQITDAVTQVSHPEPVEDNTFEDLENLEPIIDEQIVDSSESELLPNTVDEIPAKAKVDNKDRSMSLDGKIARGLTFGGNGVSFNDNI